MGDMVVRWSAQEIVMTATIRNPGVVGGRVPAALRALALASLIFAAGVQAGEQKITAGDGAALDQFGYSVGISGDTLVAGALLHATDGHFEQGAAYVFTRDGGGWGEQAKLSARDGAARDEFGFAVAVSGETVAVGSRKSDVGGKDDQGFVSIFERAGGVWTETAKLVASDGAPGDLFGHSVAIDGNTLVVGAPLVDVGPYASHGAAYVFVRAGNRWTQQAILKATDGFTADFFGLAVAVDGETVVVGVSSHDVGGNPNQGAVYVYVRQGNAWVQQAQLTAADGVGYDELGRSIAVSGDTILAGSFAGIGANAYQGAAYVFARAGGVWTQQAKLTAPDGAANDRFAGSAVALTGDTAVIGSFAHDVGPNANQGAVYLFVRQQGTWTHRAKLSAGDGSTFDNLGYSVAISGDTIVAGASGDDEGPNADQGSAYLFRANAPRSRRRAVGK
jgi:hypothetical protein